MERCVEECDGKEACRVVMAANSELVAMEDSFDLLLREQWCDTLR
jgi:hypothetical protein